MSRRALPVIVIITVTWMSIDWRKLWSVTSNRWPSFVIFVRQHCSIDELGHLIHWTMSTIHYDQFDQINQNFNSNASSTLHSGIYCSNSSNSAAGQAPAFTDIAQQQDTAAAAVAKHKHTNAQAYSFRPPIAVVAIVC